MKEYLKSKEEVLQEVGASEKGLTSQEAAEREARDGKNKLAEGKKTSFIVKFLSQFADPMIIMLLVAAAVSAGITIYNNVHSGAHESFTDVFVILFVVILNSVLGVIQESKAEQAIAALKEMTAATSKVLRDGKIEHVKSEDLVVGDVVLLEAGDSVPADGRILESASMKIEEAALTGESVPVNKHADKIDLGKATDIPLGDRKNMVYMGSTVVYGRGSAVVTGTGMKTEMGKIAAVLAKAEKEQTPLQVKLGQLSKILTYLIIGICVVIFGVELIQSWMHGTLTTAPVGVVIDSFMVAVSLAVAAIPEGLAAVVTIVLSIGVTKMSKRNAVIRKMTAVETLGCTQIICSDKTGTLTQNKMTVVDEYTADKVLLATGMALCSDAELEDGNAIGEPTECALVNYAFKNELNKNDLKVRAPRIGEAPFDSSRKMMSTVHDDGGKIIQYTKGASDVIIGRCNRILTADGVRAITKEDVAAISAENKRMADEALRVLACAYKEYDASPADFSAEALEKDLIFVGIVGMIDPIRPEVKDAVDRCHEAGIRVVMI
ncbi:MAG: HAD-IC family P-type ATPase, partial [Clostridia bacterium]|nr:HAD-IC family P-type ATPase [Clostridia bacterium]